MQDVGQICVSAFLTGPLTWPLAAILLARQQGNHSYQFSRLLASQGFRRAFAGCGPYSCYKLLGMGVQRGMQAPTLKHLKQETDLFPLLRYALAGVVSGICGGIIVCPIEQLRISRANNAFASTSHLSKYFFASGVYGLRKLMTGARITVYRNMLFDSVNCCLYNYAVDSGRVDLLDPVVVGLVNACVGVMTAVIDYPLDVLKARIQGSVADTADTTHATGTAANTAKPLQSLPPTTPFALARHMVRNEGFMSLYGGLRHKLGLYFAVWGVYGGIFSVVGNLMRYND
jgi:hypothetical protein